MRRVDLKRREKRKILSLSFMSYTIYVLGIILLEPSQSYIFLGVCSKLFETLCVMTDVIKRKRLSKTLHKKIKLKILVFCYVLNQLSPISTI